MTTYRGWRIYDNGEHYHPCTGRWCAVKWGVRIGTTTQDGLLRMLEQREKDYPTEFRD